MYWFDNCITGPTKSSLKEPHFYGCSWNGPIWPYAMSTVLDAFGEMACLKKEFKEKWLDLFSKYTELHFLTGDRSTPLILEHYRPTDGVTFSRACDYFHSTWIDLFMKYWIGIKITQKEVQFLPFAKEDFELKGVLINGKSYSFSQKNGVETLIEI